MIYREWVWGHNCESRMERSMGDQEGKGFEVGEDG